MSIDQDRIDRKYVLKSYLTQIDTTKSTGFDTLTDYELFFKLYVLTSDNPTIEDLRLFHEYKCEAMFSRILKYYAQIASEITYETEDGEPCKLITMVEDLNESCGLNQRRVFIFSYLIQIINQLAFKLVKFNIEFIQNDGLTGLFDLVRNKKFLQVLSEKDLKTLSSIFNNLNLFSRYFDHSEEFKQIWSEPKIVPVFMDIALHFKIFKIVRFVYLILANISDLDAVQSLPDINQVIRSLVSDVNSFVNYFKETPFITRIVIEKLDYKGEIKEYEVSFLNGKSLIGILYSLNKMAKDPILKYRIWESNYAKTSLKYIIVNGNDVERLYALKVLENLFPIESVMEFCLFDTALHNMLICLSKNKQTKVEEVKIVSRRIIDLTRKHDIHVEGFILNAALIVAYLMEKFVFIIDRGY